MTSLTVPPSSFLTCLRSAREALDPGEAAVGADLDVEGGLGRADPDQAKVPAAIGASSTLLGGAARPAQQAAGAAHDLARADGALDQRLGEQLGVGRLGIGEPVLGGRARAVGLAVSSVEEDRGDVDSGDAVDQRVVGLADDREAAALEPLDQPQLPERLRAVELLGEDPRGEDCAAAPRCRAGAGRCGGRGSRGSGGGRRPRPAGPARRGRSGASGGSAGPGGGARRCGRGTRRSRGRGPSNRVVEATCMCAPSLLEVKERGVESGEAVSCIAHRSSHTRSVTARHIAYCERSLACRRP